MNILQKGISISLLALLGAASVFAAPPGYGGDGREAARAAQQQQGRATEQDRQQFDRRAAPGPGQAQGQEGQGRQGKMSPEERRTLRQQINEANQFIHTPRR